MEEEQNRNPFAGLSIYAEISFENWIIADSGQWLAARPNVTSSKSLQGNKKSQFLLKFLFDQITNSKAIGTISSLSDVMTQPIANDHSY